MVAVSSIDVYQAYNNLHPQGRLVSQLQSVPLDEKSVLREQLSFQGLEYDKLNVEHTYWSYFDSCSILRMPAIYGLPDTSRIEGYFRSLVNDQEIQLNTSLSQWRFSRSLNTNCAHAVALCVGKTHREVFNVAEPHHYSEIEWCEHIASLLGVPAKIKLDSTLAIPYGMNTQQHWTVDSRKIRSMLGYAEKYDTDIGIQKVLEELHIAESV